MVEMTFRAQIDTDQRRLIIDLPDDIRTREVEVVVREVQPEPATPEVLTRETIKARLKAAGLLDETRHAPPGAKSLSVEERLALGKLFLGDRPSHELIDEDRGEY